MEETIQATLASQQNSNLDIQSAENAIKNLQGLSINNTTLNTLLGTINSGPFQIVTKCKVCSYAWGKLCWTYDNYTYTWTFPDYTSYMDSFKGYIGQLETNLTQFNTYYQPLKSWFLNTLPKATESMTTLKASTPEDIQNNLTQAVTTVTNVQAELSDAMNNISNWNQLINNVFDNIQYNYQGLQNIMQVDQNNINDYEKGMKCGQGDLTSQWTNLTTTINNEQTNFLNEIKTYGISVDAINQNISYILGPLVTMKDSLNGILNELNAAQLSPNDAIQKLDAIVSVDLWNQLVQFAQSELQ
jgi:hypothetical protein